MEQTSLMAYTELRQSKALGERQNQVYMFILNNPNCSDMDICKGLGFDDPNKTRPRRNELVKQYLIKKTGIKICKYTKKYVNTWGLF